ncbi:UPF0575 protein C19orf67-like protein [Huso huso]|uniref:UPF0575 protein C19orf67-like protein n=1 Tax=Huso huso TaxID=61971 RepID=A0ABR0Y8I0_HUSHU
MSHSEDSISVIVPATTSQELSQHAKTSISETEIATGRYCPDNIHGDNQELAQSGGEKIETTILLRSPGLPSNCQGPYVFQDAQENAGDPRTAPSYYDITLMEEKLQPVEQQLQYLLKKAEEFQTHLVYSRDRMHKEDFARAVPTFLKTCQPYFGYLESTARSLLPECRPLPEYIKKRLLQFSQQLSSSLEHLVLMYASFDFISLEETDPCSVSYFYCGEVQLGLWYHISIFRYCRPVPYIAAGEPPGLYKRMRWNVEVLESANIGDGSPVETEYYFLCCESKALGVWSISQWIQTDPKPGDDDLFSWITCIQSRGDYKQLLIIGFEEPSQIQATDLFLEVLLNQREQPTLSHGDRGGAMH